MPSSPPPLEEALEALRRSERRYRSLVEATASFTWIAAPDGLLTSDMPRWREITGQREEDLLGEGWLDAVHPADRPPTRRAWEEATAAAAIYSAEYRIRRAEGGWATLLARGAPVLDDEGRVAEYVGLCVDITERSELARALEAERALLRAIIEQAPVGLALLWGPDLVCRLANEPFLELVPPGVEVLGRSLPALVPEVAEAAQGFEQVRTTGVPARVEDYGVGGRDGRPDRFYSFTLTPVPNGEGPGGVLVVAVESTADVARRIGLEEQLERERETADALQRALLPERLPAIPGLAFAARYQPDGESLLVGGDWYDVLELAPGRVALLVGDVAGKGIRAAAVMGRLRAAVRAYALEPHAGPADVLTRLSAFCAEEPAALLSTLTYVEADPAGRRLIAAGAGHLPLLIVAPGRPAHLVWEGRTVPLGVSDPGWAEVAVGPLPPGTTVVLFTDGLVELRGATIDEGLARLLRAADAAGPHPESLCDALLAAAGPPAARRDDVAILAVRFG